MKRSLNKIFSVLLVLCMLISMMPAVGMHQHAHAATSSTLFLKPNSEWLVDGARFAAYFFGNGETWVSMTGPDSNGYYMVSVPSGYPSVIFCRMNGGVSDNNWDNKWNQTADLTIPTSGECCWTLNSGDWGGGGSWSHLWNSGSVTQAATCTAAGTKTYTCSLCSATKTESIAATGHSYSSKVTAATCTAQGYTTYTCSKCSNSYKDNYTTALGHNYTSSVTKAATCTTAGTRKYTCTRCSTSYTESIAATGHSYTSKVTAATCTAQGYTTYTCSSCGTSYKDNYTAALGHNYSGGTCTRCGTGCSHSYTSSVTKAATCTTAGTRTYTCSKCSYSYTESIAKLGHDYSSKVTAPTCTANGYTTYTCSRCSDSYTGNTTSATGHSYSSTVTKAATCTATGTKKYTCSKCSDSYTETIAKLGHDYTSKVTAPTCTAQGYTTHTCSRCSDSYQDTYTDATGHSYSGATCSACGATRSYYLFGFINGANYACEEDAANIGSYKFVNNTLTVTFTSDSYVAVKTGDNLSWYMTDGYPGDGVTSATLYNTNKGINADKLYVPGGTEVKFTLTVNTDETLELSYVITSCDHTYTSKVTKAATCTAEGVNTFTCSKCADSYTEAIPATGHSYSGSTCSSCGNVRTYYLFGYINGANYACEEDYQNIGIYEFVNGSLTVSFTSNSYVAVKTGDNNDWYMTNGYPGDGVSSATLYNTKKEGLEVNKLYVPGGTTVKFTLTVNTDETLKLSYTITSCSHNYSSEVTKEPTCTATGTKKYTCSICGDSYTESVAAVGHKYTDKVTAPTCTAQGYTTHTCSVCGDSYKDSYKDATGHSWSNGKCSVCGTSCSHSYTSSVTKAATCTATGTRKYTCSTCSYSYTETIAALGHSYKSTVTAPTCTAAGYTTYTCSTCGDSYTGNATAATGHSYGSDGKCTVCGDGCAHTYDSGKVTKAATCTSTGTKTYTCSKCSGTKTETIAALGHSYSSEVTAPTCTAGGYTTYTCSTCGDSYTGDTTAATGHSYSGGKCTVCGEAEPSVDYYLFGYINGANYACEEDSENIGIYQFVDGKLTATFSCDSYVAVKTGDNMNWYMCDGYPGDDATSATLYSTATEGIEANKLRVPGNVEISFTLTVNSDGTLTLSYVAAECQHSYESTVTTAATCTSDGVRTYTCVLCGHSYTEIIEATGHTYSGGKCTVCGEAEPTVDYYLFGFINGANYACEEDSANLGSFKFVDGKLTVTFSSNSYVAVKTGDNAKWYMTEGYDETATTVTLYNTANGISVPEKMFVPGGVEVTFSLTVNNDDTLTLSYETNATSCDHATHGTDGLCTACGTKVDHTYSGSTCTICGLERSYYLFGFINGANYACEEDEENIGIYKFVDGKLTVTFESDSYVAVKTGDNLAWYMAKEYITATSGTLYRTSTGASEKMFVPGGVEVTFSLTVGSDDTLTLSYLVDSASCTHANHGTDGKCTLCGTAVEHTFSNGDCTVCGLACAHSWTDGTCSVCGLVCVHGTWSDGTCADCGTTCAHDSHNASGVCTSCGATVEHTYVDGVCSVCGDGCAHSWSNGVCSKCGNSCDHTWSGGSCTGCGMVSEGITVHFVNTLGWSGVVAYAWEGSTDAALSGYSWPGAIINRDADGYHTFVLDYIPASGNSLGLIFHNWNGGQTADLTVDYATLNETREVWVKPSSTANSDGKYDCTVATAKTGLVLSPEVDGTSVTFRYQGSASSVYLAGSMNSWSSTATALTKGTDGIWTVTLTLQPGVHEYKLVVDGEWVADPSNAGLGGYDGNCTVVVPEDDTVTDTGKIKVVLHFYRESGDYTDWDVWFWCNESSGSCAFTADPNNKGMIASYTLDGATNLNLGYTVRKTDWSDKEFYDRYIDLSDVRSGTVHYYLNSGSASGLRVLGEDVISAAKIGYANYNYEASTVWVKTSLPLTSCAATDFSILDENGNASGVSVTGVSIDGNGYTLTLSRALSLTEACSFQVKYGNFYCTISYNAHNIFYSDKFASEYTYHGDDLGATWSKSATTFKVWAPTAKKVYVKIFDSGNWGSGNQVQYVEMKQGGSGTWYVTVTGNLSGYYYNYDVVFPSYTVEATDPYAKGVGANGDRGMIVDLDSTDPSGWANDISPNKYMNYTDAIIYELHIREMTIDSSSGVKDAWKGKYLGLTQEGTNYNGYSTGLQHLKELGVTHVQLMPAFDFNSADEYHLEDWAQYAWGYDPKNFNVPEGSYATDPFDGATRITEFKQMVQTFHSNGINVVMDVVYNHTFDGGNYCGNKIVPNYYSRFYGEGNWSNGSGVGNDFATERAMVRNLIVDSILHWVEEYHIDGFRFDLAGLIDTVTINEIVNTVHAKYPYVMFYGEGWAAGGTAVQYGYNLASQGNAWEVGGFGFFNDTYRNAIAGDNGNSWGFATGAGDKFDTIASAFRASNGWSSSPSQTINYVSCHDNYCLTDKIIISRNGAYWDQMARMNCLSTAMVMLSQGVPFIYSGDELLREKKDESGIRYDNAFGTTDYVNKIRWSDLQSKEYAQRTDDYYAGLIAFRKNHQALRCSSGSDAWNATSIHSINSNTILVYVDGYYNYECSDGIVMIFNGSDTTQWVNVQDYVPHGYYQATIHGTQAGNTPLWGKDVNGYSDAVGVEPFSVTVLVKGDLVHEESVYNQNMGLVYCSHSYHTTSGLCTNCGVSVSHSYSGGSCSVCGLSQSAPDTYTVYYDNSSTNWGSVNVYAWAEAAGRTTEFSASWPGSAMTHMGDGIYAIELPIEATNLIFNDGYGSQSSNLTAPAYDSAATMYDPSTSSWVTYEASCKHESHTTDGICTNCGLTVAHSYVEGTCSVCGGACDHTWASGTCYTCGMVCQHTSHNTSGYCVVCGVAQEHTYTSAGSCSNCGLACWHSWNGDTCNTCGYVCGHTTHTTSGMCTICGADVTHTYENGACSVCGLAEDAPDTITIYYDNAESQWETVYAYAWTEAAGRTVMYTDGWPGTAMTLVEGDIWSITLDRNASIVIFNDGSGSQTGNLSIPAYDSGSDMYLSASGTWGTYGEECEHTYESVVTDPTCTEPGYTTHTCTICGDSYTDSETEALGHSYTDGTCTVCGEVESTDETVTVYYDNTSTAWSTVRVTAETESGETITDVEMTEVSEGVYAYDLPADTTSVTFSDGSGSTTEKQMMPERGSGKNMYDASTGEWTAYSITSCEHTYESVVTDPTCTEAGYTTHTCTICGDSYTDSETEALGHSFTDGICTVCGAEEGTDCEHTYESVVTDPTCTEMGYTTHTCSICGDSYTDTETEMIDHSYVDGICEVCGAEEPEVCQHTYEDVVTDPTCTEAGYTTHTCTICGDSYTDSETEALGHSFTDGICTVCGEADTSGCAHSYSDGMCTVCGEPKPLSTTYYLVGYINGANYGCEEDGENTGIYKFEDNVLKATFESASYVFVKTGDNSKWYMCDGYPGDGVTSANLYDTTLDIQHDKVNVPGAVEITFTLIERDDGSLTLTYVKAGECTHTYYSYTSQEPGCTTTGVTTYRCSLCADSYTTSIAATGHNYSGATCTNCGADNPSYIATYYLFGYINGANYACEEDGSNIGTYKFSGGSLVATFDSPSYVAVKTGDNAKWYMCDGYPGDDVTSVTLYDTSTGIDANKMRVPGGVQITFTLRENSDGTLTLSYVAAACSHTYDDGYVSTAAGCTTTGVKTYTCTNCGATKDETIAATGHNYVDGACAGCGDVTEDYVAFYYLFGYINGANYGCEEDYANMGEYKFEDGKLSATFEADSYVGVKTSGNLNWYMAQSYISETSGTLYNTSTGAVEKMYVPGGVQVYFTLEVNDDDTLTVSYTVSDHTHEYEDVVTAPGCTEQGYTTHKCQICSESYVDSYTEPTGHSYELLTHPATCVEYADYEYVCPGCGDSTIYHAEDMADWIETIPTGMPVELFESKTEYRYRDYETLVSTEPSLEGYTLVSSQWVTGTDTIYYVVNWPSGFDTTNELYAQYDNIDKKVTDYETETEKLVVDSDEIVGYIYFHWCYADSYYSVESKSGSYTTFHAYYSTTAPSDYTCDTSDMSYETSNTSCCSDSNWYFVVEVYGQTYTTSQMEFTYERWTDWSDWSEEEATASETREVESRTLYRLPNVTLGDHVYESVVTEPTCTADGSATYTCTACGDSYTETVAATGHSYSDGTCTVCGETAVGYYLFGYINGANYACEDDWENLGEYKFVDGKLTTTFDVDSYIAVKTGDNANWYMAQSYIETTSGTFYNTATGASEKMLIPGGVEVTLTLTVNADGSLTVSYTVADEEVIVPTLNMDHPSLSFEGEIMYNLYFTADDVTSVVEMGLIAFSTKNTEGTIENAENVYPGYIEAGGMYMSQTAGVPARYLGDAVYFKAYAKLSDGSYVYSGMVGYNAVVYAKAILQNSTNDYMKRLVVAMINYGAEAQAYFCGKEGVEFTPMNSFLTADQQALINAYDASMVADLIAVDSNKATLFTYNTGDFTKRSNSVSFDGAFAINYYFTAKDTPDNGMKFYYWNTADYLAADVLTPENATGSMDMVAVSGNQYWSQVSGIAAKEVDQTYFVAGVYELDGVTYTTGILAYSLGKYCARLAAGTTDQQALSAATAVYGYYAKEYFANAT